MGDKVPGDHLHLRESPATDPEQRITIGFPFMPRPGDLIQLIGVHRLPESKVIAPELTNKEDKDAFLLVLARGRRDREGA